jgi:hypothetical protein
VENTDALRARLWSNTRVDDNGCWTWTGPLNPKGYGKINIGGTTHQVHRLGALLAAAPFDPELTLDHLCRNRASWNPAHLEPVPLRENILRGVGPTALNARKTHCPQGHEYTEDNIRRRADRPNERECKTCHRAAKARRRR